MANDCTKTKKTAPKKYNFRRRTVEKTQISLANNLKNKRKAATKKSIKQMSQRRVLKEIDINKERHELHTKSLVRNSTNLQKTSQTQDKKPHNKKSTASSQKRLEIALSEQKTVSQKSNLKKTDLTKADKHGSKTISVPSCDSITSEFHCTELAQAICLIATQKERRRVTKEDYMAAIQKDIEPRMRTILIDWLQEVAEKLRLKGETIFLAVNYLDRFLAQKVVSRSQLQLVGVVALFIACKMEEIKPPLLRNFLFVCDGMYSRDQFLAIEKKMANKLKWKFVVPTSLFFSKRFLRVLSYDRTAEVDGLVSARTRETVSMLLEMALTQYGFVTCRPSTIAAAAVILAFLLEVGGCFASGSIQFGADFSVVRKKRGRPPKNRAKKLKVQKRANSKERLDDLLAFSKKRIEELLPLLKALEEMVLEANSDSVKEKYRECYKAFVAMRSS